MQGKRSVYKYEFLLGDEVIAYGITSNLELRERDLQERWPRGRIRAVGRPTTWAGAQRWERQQDRKSLKRAS